LFGAPVGHVDDVKRALRVADACARLPTSEHEAVAVRIGVETGEALVDLAGLEDRQRMAVGTCVNVAARLQGRADAGQVLVGTTRLIEEFTRSVTAEARLLRARIRPGTEVGTSPLQQLIADAGDTTVPSAVAHSAGLATDPRLMALPLVDRRNEIYVAWRDYL